MRTPNTKCSICSKPLYRRPYEFKNWDEFCCRSCRSELYKNKPSIWNKNLNLGHGWNRGMRKKNGDDLSYGKPRSDETRNKISSALKRVLKKHGVMKPCSICGDEFYVFPSGNHGQRFCSNKCKHKASIKQDIRKCIGCGIMFSTNKKRVKTYCTKICFYKNCKATDIENLIEEWLISKNIEFEKQKPLCDKITITDFFIKPNIAIYCDGDYWHSLPSARKKDSYINRTLRYNGFKVICILGSDIKLGVRPNEIL